MKVAVVKPPIIGHKYRGTGVYTENLYKYLTKIPEVSVNLVNYGSDFTDFDLVHFPYFDPFFLTLPLVKRKPVIVTVHDLVPLKFPQYFKRGIRGELKWFIQKISLKDVRAIITDSLASKEDIVKYAGINEDKVHVIHLGVDENFKVIKDKTTLNLVKEKYHLPEDFILHVGDVNYNKNISGLIQAFSNIAKEHGDISFVLIGSGFVDQSEELSEVLEIIRKLGVENRVLRYKYVPLEDLVCIYNLAKVYLQLSWAEGFGLPVLEAMASSCPVVASNLSSLKEIMGTGGILVDVQNTAEVAKKIKELLRSKLKRQSMTEKGLAWVKKFSWQKTAYETVAVYQKIL